MPHAIIPPTPAHQPPADILETVGRRHHHRPWVVRACQGMAAAIEQQQLALVRLGDRLAHARRHLSGRLPAEPTGMRPGQPSDPVSDQAEDAPAIVPGILHRAALASGHGIEQLAAALGCSTDQVLGATCGAYRPTLEALPRWARVLHVPARERTILTLLLAVDDGTELERAAMQRLVAYEAAIRRDVEQMAAWLAAAEVLLVSER